MRAYKFRIYPSSQQEQLMFSHLKIAKNLWNELLEHTKFMYNNFDKFPTRDSLQRMTKNSGLYSQTSQDIAHRIEDSIKRFLSMRKKGVSVGFPRFRSIDRHKSLYYPQKGFSIKNKILKVTPFGIIKIKQHREIIGKIKTLSLKREPSGKWYSVVTVEESVIEFKSNNKTEVGIDVGLKTFATFSDETTIDNPRIYEECQNKLADIQRNLSKKKSGSQNRRKAKIKLARLHEHIVNKRMDFLHKQSYTLVRRYSLIVVEDLNIEKMKEQAFGKYISDASWAEFIRMLDYKAESAGCRVVKVNPAYTTKVCSDCGNVREISLSGRVYNCEKCGLTIDRDLNASRNILQKATLGKSGSNASGDAAIAASVNEEAHLL